MKNINLVRLPLAVLATVIISVAQSAPAHAASFNVAVGNDETTTNSSCSLSEAIQNINDQAATSSDCPAGDGVNDTINLPAGTITLVADLPVLTKTATFKGAGAGQSIIDGDGQYQTIQITATASEMLTVSDFTVTGFRGFGIGVQDANLDADRIEIDGLNATSVGASLALSGFGVENGVDGVMTSISINNSYVHRFNSSAAGIGLPGILVYTNNKAILNLSVSNTTVSDIENTDSEATASGIMVMGGIIAGGSPSTLNANFENVTISNIRTSSIAIGLGLISYTGAEDSTTTAKINNSTITDIAGGESSQASGFGSTSLVVAGGGVSGTANVSLETDNLLLADIKSLGVPNACEGFFDYTPLFGGSGGFNGSLTSGGGNLSDDTTCSTYFNHVKDQNNLTALGSTLGPLQNNGGYVPTMALMSGSPAIDSGVTIAGLTQDARGSVRPQGLAYDSGAYESPFTTAVNSLGISGAANTLPKTGQSETVLIAISLVSVATSIFLVRRLRLIK
ncbi:LPXTG cell wall anchor domain-containing protein [Candidatus Saccharibacteria bacterium]|jgi:LPXTG-motif cell wall-anchored protein|nr:LPXTG cell wall anchor domain-containing protein [Candidatus Saccharibacteria bacterium]